MDGEFRPIPQALFQTARTSWQANKRADWMHKFDEKGLLCEQHLPVKGKPQGYAERKDRRMLDELNKTDERLKAAKQARPSDKEDADAVGLPVLQRRLQGLLRHCHVSDVVFHIPALTLNLRNHFLHLGLDAV